MRTFATPSHIGAVLLGSVLLGARPASAGAQRGIATIDVGAAALRQGDTLRSSGASLTPAFVVAWPRATIGTSLTLSQIAGGWGSQGMAGASVFTPPAGPFVLEVAGTGGGSRHAGGAGTWQLQAVARAHLMKARAGGWVGIGSGRTHDGFDSRGVVLGEAGAWTSSGPLSVVGTVSPTIVDDSVRFADAQVGVRWRLPRAEVGVVGGFRGGDDMPVLGSSARAWGSGSVTLWLVDAVAVVASAGSYPVDLTQGFPGGRFASVGIRLASPGARPAAIEHASRTTGVREAERAGVVGFVAERTRDGAQRFEVRAPRARRVELMGDFTDWAPVVLRRIDGDRWQVTVAVPPGTHQLNLRIDGGAWVVPPGLPSMRDEFGGEVGLLTVP